MNSEERIEKAARLLARYRGRGPWETLPDNERAWFSWLTTNLLEAAGLNELVVDLEVARNELGGFVQRFDDFGCAAIDSSPRDRDAIRRARAIVNAPGADLSALTGDKSNG